MKKTYFHRLFPSNVLCLRGEKPWFKLGLSFILWNGYILGDICMMEVWNLLNECLNWWYCVWMIFIWSWDNDSIGRIEEKIHPLHHWWVSAKTKRKEKGESNWWNCYVICMELCYYEHARYRWCMSWDNWKEKKIPTEFSHTKILLIWIAWNGCWKLKLL